MRSSMLICVTVSAAGLLTLAAPARAISDKNRDLLAEHFASQGTVQQSLYTPLGGPEIGAAVIDSGSSRMEVVQVQGRELKTLLTLSMPAGLTQPPFSFLLTGNQLLTYPTVNWTDGQGLAHRRGDLAIYDLTPAEGPKKLYELQDVLDLSYEAAGSLTPEVLIWQPQRHFLNSGATLPIKHDYFRLTLDLRDGQYKLRHALTPQPDAATVDAANINNRALLYYSFGRLSEAARLLEQATQLSEVHQSDIYGNQQIIKSELYELAQQGNVMPDRPFSEAQAYFWQGDFAAVLRSMENRTNYSDEELGMLGLSLAQLKRWPDVDATTIELERRNVPWMADYLAQLTAIARFDRFYEIAHTYLLALQVTDSRSPGYAVNLAAMYALTGDTAKAEQLLERFIGENANSGRDLSGPRLELYRLYRERGNTAGCDQLAAAALAGTLGNLRGAVDLTDYIDFSAALSDVPLGESDRIKAPEDPLESLSLPDPPETGNEPGWREIHEGESTD